jgi:hypothetical protein
LELNAIPFWPFPGTKITTNPENYNLEIIDEQSFTSISDYPVVKTKDLSSEQIAGYIFSINQSFKYLMNELAVKLSIDRIIDLYRYYKQYNYYNSWFSIISTFERYARFSALYLAGAINKIDEISMNDIKFWHPLRTCSLHVMNGSYFASDLQIKPDEYQILVASSGKFTTQQASNYCGFSVEYFLNKAVKLQNLSLIGFSQY